MDAPLILADQILTLIREAGVSKMQAHAALNIAGNALTAVSDISFRNDLPELEESASLPPDAAA